MVASERVTVGSSSWESTMLWFCELRHCWHWQFRRSHTEWYLLGEELPPPPHSAVIRLPPSATEICAPLRVPRRAPKDRNLA